MRMVPNFFVKFKIYATDYLDDHKTSQDITFFIDRNYPPTFKSTVQLLNMTGNQHFFSSSLQNYTSIFKMENNLEQ